MYVLLFQNVVGALEHNNVCLEISMVLLTTSANGTIMYMMGLYGADFQGLVHGIGLLSQLITPTMIMEVHSDTALTTTDHTGVDSATIQLVM